MDYAVVIERAADGSYSAYVPDLPGCVSCGDAPDEVRALIAEAVALHIESLREHGEPVSPPTTPVLGRLMLLAQLRREPVFCCPGRPETSVPRRALQSHEPMVDVALNATRVVALARASRPGGITGSLQ